MKTFDKGRRNVYADMRLRRQLYLESAAMAEYAMAKGKKIPAQVLNTIESFEEEIEWLEKRNELRKKGAEADLSSLPPRPSRLPLDPLCAAHDKLARLVEPAIPQTILLLDIEQERPGLFKFMGPVSLVRRMMGMAVLCILLFIGLALSDFVEPNAGNIYRSSGGLSLLVNLLFYLSAAGLGASFMALYTANAYITKGAYDPAYEASYWIRFALGLIAGLTLSVIMSDTALKDASAAASGDKSPLIDPDMIQVLLAMLGGFSADLVYTFLSRLVETLRSLFQGSTEAMIAARTQEARANLESQAVHSRMKLASELIRLQQDMGSDIDPEQLRLRMNKLLEDVMPDAEPAAGVPAVEREPKAE